MSTNLKRVTKLEAGERVRLIAECNALIESMSGEELHSFIEETEAIIPLEKLRAENNRMRRWLERRRGGQMTAIDSK